MSASSATARTESTHVDPARIRLLLEGSVENLLGSWDEQRALLPFSSRLNGATIVNDYDNPIAVRYTINSLLGLLEAARAGDLTVREAKVQRLCQAFFAADRLRISLPADHGLATVLHASRGAGRGVLMEQVRTLDAVLASSAAGTLNMQDLAWILWGGSAAVRAGVAAGADVVRAASSRITGELIEPSTGLPRHSSRRYRRDVVSFGALAYFLRAMHEAADTLGSNRPRALFEDGVARAISLQGPCGEWPWMINCRTGTAVDFYPVFAVHQDSMAMLFLHPALDSGLRQAGEAIGRSLAWDFGANELGHQMFVERPFFAYRSIERRERAPRLRRYLRSRRPGQVARPAAPDASDPRINDECRSYHLGWFLFVWAGRPEARSSATASQTAQGARCR